MKFIASIKRRRERKKRGGKNEGKKGYIFYVLRQNVDMRGEKKDESRKITGITGKERKKEGGQ